MQSMIIISSFCEYLSVLLKKNVFVISEDITIISKPFSALPEEGRESMVESVCELPPLESHPMEAFLPSLLSSPLPIIIISRERRRELSLIGIMQPRVNRPREGGVVSAERRRAPYFSGRPYFT